MKKHFCYGCFPQEQRSGMIRQPPSPVPSLPRQQMQTKQAFCTSEDRTRLQWYWEYPRRHTRRSSTSVKKSGDLSHKNLLSKGRGSDLLRRGPLRDHGSRTRVVKRRPAMWERISERGAPKLKRCSGAPFCDMFWVIEKKPFMQLDTYRHRTSSRSVNRHLRPRHSLSRFQSCECQCLNDFSIVNCGGRGRVHNTAAPASPFQQYSSTLPKTSTQ